MRGRGEGKRIKRFSGSGGVAVLPIDIIRDEILLRLPVKSLLRFKSVCKLWYSVIKDTNFIRIHYHIQNQTNRIRPLFQQQLFPTDTYQPISFNPDAIMYEPISSWPLVTLDPLKSKSGGNSLFSYYVGMPSLDIFLRPVNGFLLMLRPIRKLHRCRMAMLNPATKQFRFLVDFEFNCDNLRNHVFGYGICKYADHNHVYKVVWLNITPNRDDDDFAIAKVYTVGDGGVDGGWRTMNAAIPINFVNNYSLTPYLNTTMNGKCYWLSRDFEHILVFDMDEEVFREMKSPVPSLLEMEYSKLFTGVVLSKMRCFDGEGDSLALFMFEIDCVDILVMDKEEEWHWIRRIVSYVDRPIHEFLNPLMHPQLPITNDSILLKAGHDSFALYNPKTNRCVHFCQQSYEGNYAFLSVFNFKESLFSLDGGIQVSKAVLKDFCTF